jgi:hypothetical protein
MGFLKKVEKEVKRAGRKIDDEILQPVKNTVEAIIEDPKKLLAVGIAIAFPGAGAFLGAQLGLTGVAAQVVGQTMLNTALNGGDVKSAVIAAAIPVVGRTAAAGISSTLAESGIEGALNRTITNSLVQGGTAAALGKDPTAAFLFGGVSSAVPALTSQIPGFDDLPDFAKQSIISGVSAELTGGDGGQAAINSALSYAKREAGTYFRDLGMPQPADFEKGSFEYDQIFDPKTSGLVDLSEKPYDPNYELTTDFSVGADYSLAPKEDGLGFKVTAPPEVFNEDGSVNYELFDYDALSQLGMDMPKSPNIDGMGGGQGLRLPVEGGYITEQGFIPEGYTPDLGDPNSFINKPAPGGDVSIKGALDAGAKATLADMNKQPGAAKPPAKPGTPGQDVDFNQLMSLLGGGQQAAPMVVSSGQDNSADVQLMENIFGPSLSAPPAGDPNEQARELARLLRS